MSVVVLFSLSLVNYQQEALEDVLYTKAKTISQLIVTVTSDAIVENDYGVIVENNQKVILDNTEIVYLIISSKRLNDSKIVNKTPLSVESMNKNYDSSLEGHIFSSKNDWKIIDKLPMSLENINSDKERSAILKSSLVDKEVFHFSYPILFSGVKWGWVSVGLSLKKYNQQMRTIYLNSLYLLIAIFFASMLFSFVLVRWLLRPILSLNRAAKQVADGDLSVKVSIDSKDEVQQLADSFNHMVLTIKESNEKLKNSNVELELRVANRTKELKELNEKLDQRVKEEVQKRTEQEQILIQQSRSAAMGEMIGNIAHQWRQPLNALSLLLQNVENAYEMDMIDEKYIHRTVEKGIRLTTSMSNTIDDFRNFFKPNKVSEIFSISSSLNSIMDIMNSSLKNSMIKIEEDIDDTVCMKGFPSEFSQVVLNILNNAKDVLIEREIKEKKIFIRIFRDGVNACIEIEDNAGGVPDEVLDKLFDPYFTTKEEGKGTGIGLYMSKTIIENNMHGTLSVKNTKYGASFIIKMKLEACQRIKNE